MAGNQPEDPEGQALPAFLAAQREAVLSTVAGLDEEAWHRPVVPSGWTPAGLVEHLGDAERHWVQGVVAGADTELPWDAGRPPYDPQAAFVCDRPSAEVTGYYTGQCARSDAAGADAAAGAATRQARRPADGRTAEARHAGHLDLARELIDGQTVLGPR